MFKNDKLLLKLAIKDLYKLNILNNKSRQFILKNNLFNNKFNTNNDKNYKFNFKKNLIYEF